MLAVVYLFIQLVYLIFLAQCCHCEDDDDDDDNGDDKGGDC